MSLAIILVRPQMGENIGAAARAMANFGVRDLRIVAPRDGWPNVKASDTAGKAIDLIDDAQIFATVEEALADRQFVLATTARERSMSLPVMDVRPAMLAVRAKAATGLACAVLFGPERTGLENEDMALADAVVTIPVSPDYASLNVGQAVVVVCHEWFTAAEMPGREAAELAPRGELSGLLGQLETALDDVNFWRVPGKKDIMWRNIRATLVRAGMNAQEIATWRGLVKALRGE